MKGDFKSKWKTQEEWDLKVPPNYRQRLPNEIVLETDYEKPRINKEVIEKASSVLKHNKISHQIWFSGNKSYHLNIYFDKWLTILFAFSLSIFYHPLFFFPETCETTMLS